MIVTRTHVIKIKHIFYQIVLNLLDVNAEFLRKPLHNFWDMSFKTQAPINSKHYQLWNAAALSETSLLLFTLSPWYRFKMCFTKEDRILIKLLRQDKKYNARQHLKEFTAKLWCRAAPTQLLLSTRAGFTTWDIVKDGLIEEWRRFLQCFIDKAIKAWRVQLRACVREKMGHFECKL